MSCVVCCFGCLSVCGCQNYVARRLVFFPPKPMYALEDRVDDKGQAQQVMWVMTDNGEKVLPYSSRNFRVEFIDTPRKSRLAVMCIRYPNSPFTVLFSHGNATDLGCMRDHLIDMAMQLKVSVVCYDYTGYGLSSGKPTVKDTLIDAETVYNYLTVTMNVPPQQIILYGQSLGSGPTCHLAAKHQTAGVVLHCGIMSGLRVIRDVKSTSFFDIFANIDLIKKCEAPVFIIHAKLDQEIPVHHGEGLYEAAKVKYEPWFVEGAGHNNIEVHFRQEYFEKLKRFVDFLSKRQG